MITDLRYHVILLSWLYSFHIGDRQMTNFTLTPRGSYSLAESAGFAFIDRPSGPRVPELRIAFCRDSGFEPVGLHLTQASLNAEVAVVGDRQHKAQIERILGLDVDGGDFSAVGQRDPVVGALQEAAPGLRPPMLPSAYEAAAWCILQARRPGPQARQMRERLAEQAGTILTVAGQQVPCMPPPASLANATAVPGMDPVRLERLQGIARAALDGRLDTAALKAMDVDDARREVETLAGIGPFSSAIIVGRSLGHTDALFGPITELNSYVGDQYGLGHPATASELADIAAIWSPWRAWTQVLFRAVIPRLSAASRLGLESSPMGSSR
jgi:DNA-3-methyladenine glycosylase II